MRASRSSTRQEQHTRPSSAAGALAGPQCWLELQPGLQQRSTQSAARQQEGGRHGPTKAGRQAGSLTLQRDLQHHRVQRGIHQRLALQHRRKGAKHSLPGAVARGLQGGPGRRVGAGGERGASRGVPGSGVFRMAGPAGPGALLGGSGRAGWRDRGRTQARSTQARPTPAWSSRCPPLHFQALHAAVAATP